MCRGKIGKFCFFVLPFAAALFLVTCGLEDYPVIYPVHQSDITQELNNRAVVTIRTDNAGTAFTHFAIFYRIYVSDIRVDATTISDAAQYYTINSTLGSDYAGVNPYIDSDTLVNTNMDTFFTGRGYKYLFLNGPDIDNVLNSSVLGKTLTFYFPSQFSSGGPPTMTIGSTDYILWRSTGSGTGIYTPRPDRNFVNNDDLWNPDYLNSDNNADVVNKTGITGSDPHYTYAAMYIVAIGIDNTNYSQIYSTPSLIHVFLLPAP